SKRCNEYSLPKEILPHDSRAALLMFLFHEIAGLVTGLLFFALKVVSIAETTKGKHNALDHFRDTARPMATWDGQFLHAGRFHSHSAGDRNRGAADQHHQWKARRIAVYT